MFKTFNTNLENYIYLIIPPLIKLCEDKDINILISIESIKLITYLCRNINFNSYFSMIIEPLN